MGWVPAARRRRASAPTCRCPAAPHAASSAVASAGHYVAADVRYIRFTNRDSTNFITLTLGKSFFNKSSFSIFVPVATTLPPKEMNFLDIQTYNYNSRDIIISRTGENILRRMNQIFAKTMFEFSSEITIALFIMKPANNAISKPPNGSMIFDVR